MPAYETVVHILKHFKLGWPLALQACFLILYGMDIVMGFILFTFLKFHIKLVIENKTTIETLDHKNQEFHSKYDKGAWENWYEVMGVNKLLWFIPLKRYQGKPKGNGIEWGEHEEPNSASDRAQENAKRNSMRKEEEALTRREWMIVREWMEDIARIFPRSLGMRIK